MCNSATSLRTPFLGLPTLRPQPLQRQKRWLKSGNSFHLIVMGLLLACGTWCHSALAWHCGLRCKCLDQATKFRPLHRSTGEFHVTPCAMQKEATWRYALTKTAVRRAAKESPSFPRESAAQASQALLGRPGGASRAQICRSETSHQEQKTFPPA